MPKAFAKVDNSPGTNNIVREFSLFTKFSPVNKKAYALANI